MNQAINTLDRPFAFASDRPSLNLGPAGVAAGAIVLGTLYLNAAVNWRQAVLFLVGAAAGIVLYHAAFGFTSSWRVFVADGRGAGLRAQMLMLAVTCAIFFPLLAAGHAFGQPLRGSVSPAGISVIVGAFLFGVGMQLGGGCASGTLYTAGGGSTRMVMTLLAFIAGSVIGTLHVPWWTATPALKPISLVTTLGPLAALLISSSLFGVLTLITIAVERRRHGQLAVDSSPRTGWRRLLHGPWPLVAGALGLALVNIATLAIWAALGCHLGVCSLGRQSAGSRGRQRGVMALLVDARAGGDAQGERGHRRDFRDGRGNHPGRARRGGDGGTLRTGVARAAALAGGGDLRRHSARLWRPHRVRL